MGDYRIKVTVRNARILRAIEEMGFSGFGMQAEFARFAGMHVTDVNALVALRRAPINKGGDFCESAKQLMEVLGCAPTELWTAEQLNMELPRNTYERDVSTIDMLSYVEDREHLKALVDKSNLTPRQRRILSLRFDGAETLEEVGNEFNVSRDRVRQIEEQSLRKLREASMKLDRDERDAQEVRS